MGAALSDVAKFLVAVIQELARGNISEGVKSNQPMAFFKTSTPPLRVEMRATNESGHNSIDDSKENKDPAL